MFSLLLLLAGLVLIGLCFRRLIERNVNLFLCTFFGWTLAVAVAARTHTTRQVVIVGNGAVGKSSMIQRFCKGVFTRDYKKTIGVDFLERIIE